MSASEKPKSWKPILERWWDNLKENDRGGRAKLRRCESPLDVMLVPAFHNLFNQLKDCIPTKNISAVAAIAGLASHVDSNASASEDDRYWSFAKQLGNSKENSEKPFMSEIRFYKLIKSKDFDEFYKNVRRAMMMLNRNVNLPALADCILEWDKENSSKFRKESSKSFKFSMVKNYYSQVFKNEGKEEETA
jgi:CRISPR system Cascade subunit CasB